MFRLFKVGFGFDAKSSGSNCNTAAASLRWQKKIAPQSKIRARKAVFGIVLFILLPYARLSFGAAAPDSCSTVQDKLDDALSQLTDLNNLNDDLNRRFKTQLEEDLNTQSEGLLDELHHDAAVKIAYARRKLAIAISTKQAEITGLKNEYCHSCRLAEVAKPKQTEFCEICSGREDCRNYKP